MQSDSLEGYRMEENKPVSAEKLNEYIRVTSPGLITLIAAMALVMAAVLYWGFTGSVYEMETFTGIVNVTGEKKDVVCFLNADTEDPNILGKAVNIRIPGVMKADGVVSFVDSVPTTQEEYTEQYELARWEMNHLMADGTYFYVVSIDIDKDMSEYQGQIVEATITMSERSPISLLLR